MDFAEQIKELAARVEKNKDHVVTEEATKLSLVIPFLQVLGYEPSDPTEVIPEFSPEMVVKKDERVDYAICFNNEKEPTILIEVKDARTPLRIQNISQLQKYFNLSKSKLAILTNGIQYQFFIDVEDTNRMDHDPFLIVDLVPSIHDSKILELKKFRKEKFNIDEIRSSSRDLKYIGEIKRIIKEQVEGPKDDFIKFLVNKTSFKGKGSITEKKIEQFKPIVKNAFDHYLKEIVGDKLNVARVITKEIDSGGKIGPKDELRLRFWTQLLAYAKTRTDLHPNIKPRNGGWIGTRAGMAGLGYSYNIAKHQGIVALYIDRGDKKKEENDKIFERLLKAKNEIEKSFGGPLDWDRREDVRYRCIKKTISEGGYLDEQSWPKLQETMVEAMITLEKAIDPLIKNIRKELE